MLATTRLGQDQLFERQPDRCFLALDELPEDDALALIERLQPGGAFAGDEDRQAARAIVRRLGGFTLAVEGVAVYLGVHPEVTCAGFLARLEAEGLSAPEEVVAEGEVGEQMLHREKQLSLALRPMLDALSNEESYVLECAALLPADSVPLPWLRVLTAAEFPAGMESRPGYPDPWQQVVRRLLGRRLLVATADRDTLRAPRVVRMHRLVQELLTRRGRPAEPLRERIVAHAESRAVVLREDWVKPEDRWEIEPLRALAEAMLSSGGNSDAGPWFAHEAGTLLERLGEYRAAEPLLRRALEASERLLGPEHPNTLVYVTTVALLFSSQGNYAAAEPLCRRALKASERVLGPEHPHTLTSINNLANLFCRQTKDLPVVISGVLTNLAAFRDKQREVRESSMRLGARYDSISTAFKQLIVSIQFHDITRQQVQHVIDTLRQVFSESPDGDGGASRASAAVTVLLQSRQLANAGEKFAASVASVAGNMDEIAQHVLEMAGESRLLSGLSEDETHGFLLEMEKISTAMLASLSHCSSTQGSIHAASGDLAGMIRRAAHLGAAGNVLGVLAASMQEFASECKARSRCLTETLGAMSAAANRLSGQDGSQPAGSSCAPDGDLEPMRAAVAELHSSSERSFAQIARILSCGERLSHDLAATRRSFTVGDVFAKAIVRARTMLEEIGGQAWSGLPDDGVAAPERDLADLARIYTMRAEREVHEAVAREVAGAAAASAETVVVESPPGEGGEFGVNVEFF